MSRDELMGQSKRVLVDTVLAQAAQVLLLQGMVAGLELRIAKAHEVLRRAHGHDGFNEDLIERALRLLHDL